MLGKVTVWFSLVLLCFISDARMAFSFVALRRFICTTSAISLQPSFLYNANKNQNNNANSMQKYDNVSFDVSVMASKKNKKNIKHRTIQLHL